MKRVLVTGGSRGLGLAVCRALASDGYQVATVSRKGSPALSKLMAEFPGAIEPHFADLGDLDGIQELCAKLRTRDGLDGFVANAAIGAEGLLSLTSRSHIEQCVQLNLLSVILLTREVIKGMLERGGSVIFISSVSAIRGFSGLSVYSATKGALLSFSRALAREYGPRGLRFNCLLPGFFESEMTQTLSSEQKERVQKRTALKRLGDSGDLVGAVKFLLSDESRFMTGGEIVVDGGLTS
jgi:3-oxoacyl-[acyl-carrier protein] reductase